MKKFASVEGPAKVLTPHAHKRAEDSLHKQGKVSAQELTDEEREFFNQAVAQAE